jgi:hypothetical protein
MGGVETMIPLIKINDKKELIKHLSFMTMGDGGVYKYKNGKDCYFVMNMLSVNDDYILKCAGILKNYTSVRITDVKLQDDGYTRQPKKRLESKPHPILTKMRERIYVGTYKSIDIHALKLLDYEALSYLYMSNGSYHHKSNIPRGKSDEHRVTLNLKRLSYGDQLLLKQFLEEKLGLIWNINKDGGYYYLRLINKCVDEFMEKISSYILPSFKYKIKEGYCTVSPEMNSGDDIVRSL